MQQRKQTYVFVGTLLFVKFFYVIIILYYIIVLLILLLCCESRVVL